MAEHRAVDAGKFGKLLLRQPLLLSAVQNRVSKSFL